MNNKLLVIGFMSIGLMLTNCSSKKSSAPGSKSKTDDCTTSKTSTSKTATSKTSTSKTSAKAELTGYGLAGSTYSDIESIIDDNCVSCHVAGGVGGVDLSTYKTLKANAAKVIETINADDDTVMPPGKKMKSSNIDKIQLWVDDGKKDGSASSEDDEEEVDEKPQTTTKPTSTKKDTSSDCGSSGSSSGEDDVDTEGDESSSSDDGDSPTKDVKKDEIDPKLFDMYIEPLELKNCYAEGHPYLRTGTVTPDDSTPRCDTAVSYPAKFTCDKAGVLAAFSNDDTVTANVESLVSEGYLFDQCGVAGSKPVVYFVCFSGEDGKCVAKDKLAGGTLTIKTSYFNRP